MTACRYYNVDNLRFVLHTAKKKEKIWHRVSHETQQICLLFEIFEIFVPHLCYSAQCTMMDLGFTQLLKEKVCYVKSFTKLKLHSFLVCTRTSTVYILKYFAMNCPVLQDAIPLALEREFGCTVPYFPGPPDMTVCEPSDDQE